MHSDSIARVLSLLSLNLFYPAYIHWEASKGTIIRFGVDLI